jgi:hypothetical protein
VVVLLLEIGKNLYKMIGKSGKPWGGSSTAIVAGIGIRLINQSLLLSQLELSLKVEMEECFTYCDLDDSLLSDLLQQKEVELNKASLLLLHTIVKSLQRVIVLSHHIDEKFTSDFTLGVTYCFAAAKGCRTLIVANGLDDKTKSELDILEKKLKDLKFIYNNNGKIV